MMIKMMKSTLLSTLMLTAAVGLTPHVKAAPAESHPFSISAPNFLIPLGGKIATLDIYTDGRPPETTGFNVLGNQRLLLLANTESSGSLTLNLHFSGFTPDIGTTVESVELRFSTFDLDIFPEQFAPGITLTESGSLTGINGVTLANPFSFASHLPRGTTVTDDKLITLEPFLINQSALPGVNFAEPFVLTFRFDATVTSRGSRNYNLFNAAEKLASDIQLTVVPSQVPEPSTLTMLGCGALGLGLMFWRRRKS